MSHNPNAWLTTMYCSVAIFDSSDGLPLRGALATQNERSSPGKRGARWANPTKNLARRRGETVFVKG
jgi:hypothetical protein